MTAPPFCCLNCRYSHQLERGAGSVDLGAPIPMVCRRYPKQMTLSTGMAPDGMPGIVAGAAYPPTTPESWCGEYCGFPDQKSA